MFNKKTLTGGLVAGTLLLLSACGGGQPTTESNQNMPDNMEININPNLKSKVSIDFTGKFTKPKNINHIAQFTIFNTSSNPVAIVYTTNWLNDSNMSLGASSALKYLEKGARVTIQAPSPNEDGKIASIDIKQEKIQRSSLSLKPTDYKNMATTVVDAYRASKASKHFGHRKINIAFTEFSNKTSDSSIDSKKMRKTLTGLLQNTGNYNFIASVNDPKVDAQMSLTIDGKMNVHNTGAEYSVTLKITNPKSLAYKEYSTIMKFTK